ncbi:Imm6 family immunity protein [Burkholderia cenocepacia]|uniref:Imm6 family immunity protein n=1 Tax=Burkholderia cenocepacia TaxID=95486 RepID=UPI002AB12148|nr:Imm6 family immunity protein [Burkholderia cenocepacia]
MTYFKNTDLSKGFLQLVDMQCLDERPLWFAEERLLTDFVNKLMAMPWEKRVLSLLAMANRANETIKASHPESFEVCERALVACKDWLNGKPITPENLAFYLDADETKNPWMQESIFSGDPAGLNALAFMTMVIGHTAHLAYVNSGKSKYMSEIISEAGSNIFESIVEYGAPYGLAEFIK